MNRKNSVAAGIATGVLATALAVTVIPGQASAGKSKPSHPAVGLTMTNRLVAFDLTTPERPRVLGKVTGLEGDARIVGIDYRVQDGKLYGVGDDGGVYTLSGNAKATKVSQLTVALEGTRFGVDFNPAADRLRVISDTGQNLRHDVNAGGATTVDSTLTYPATPTAPAATAVGVSGAAYTNNDLDADTATSLFDLDTALDQVTLQAPANAGLLSATGKLGVDAGSDAGFDIFSRQGGGTTQINKGWATLQVNGKRHLFSVSLLTGDVDHAGRFPEWARVTDLAVKLDR
ncbi:DUF4394 domain-containing protein [Nocardioides sp.]|uniref:DUF4394 domain-containing protein n=1 Tax=Nocardioides sp. TaxID=35761 RepID=UPI003D152994